jgi:cytochrome c551/c552
MAGSITMVACSENAQQDGAPPAAADGGNEAPATTQAVAIEEIAVSTPLNAEWIKAGKAIYEMKCQSCHKLTDEKLVGPGWKGVTERRSPGWIVAITTRPEEMLEKDPEAIKLLEEHLIKMPNQNVSAEEARQLLEFMRSNDGVK